MCLFLDVNSVFLFLQRGTAEVFKWCSSELMRRFAESIENAVAFPGQAPRTVVGAEERLASRRHDGWDDGSGDLFNV